MRSKDKVIIAAMMIIAFLIVAFLGGFIALILIEDSMNSNNNRTPAVPTNAGSSNFVPVSSNTGDTYNVYSNENRGDVIEVPVGNSNSNLNQQGWNEYIEEQNREVNNERYQNIINNREQIDAKEEEMTHWCDRLHSNSCLRMEYTWFDGGCKPIEVTCKKYDDDDICYRYDVDIIDKFVDDEFCE